VKIPSQELRDEDVAYDNVSSTIIGQRRWVTVHEIVFLWKDGKHYKTVVDLPSTEMQEDMKPWEYEDEVECTEVELQNVTIQKWVPVKKEA